MNAGRTRRLLFGAACTLLFRGLVGASFLSLALRVWGVWLILLFAPGVTARADTWWKAGDLPARLGSLVLVSSAWDLSCLFLIHLAGGGLRTGLVLLSLTFPLLTLSPWPRRVSSPAAAKRVLILLGVGAIVLFIHLGRQTPQLRIDSDVPAHLGAIHDALTQNRLLPLDGSFPGAPTARDPRMGILHGVHAALAEVLTADPARVWGLSGGILSLMFLVCFTWLFTEWGLTNGVAILASLFLALGAGGGSPLGVWGAVYPAQFALALAAASGAWLLRGRRDHGGAGQWWIGAAGLGLSVLIHPFAWWGMCIVLGHLVILSWIMRRPREESLAVLRFLVLSGALGIVLVLPLMLHEPKQSGQWELAGILRFGDIGFTMDPLLVLRWSGVLAPLAIVLVVWRWRRWKNSLPGLFMIASALPIWTITFDPFLQPFVFKHCGYLSERLGLLAGGPAIVLLALQPLGSSAWGPVRRGVFGLVLLGLGVGGWIHLKSSPYRQSDSGESTLAKLSATLSQMGGVVVADPLTSYALRGTMGGTFALLPVSHASPLDGNIETRMVWYRTMLAEDAPPSEFQQALRALSPSLLVLRNQVEEEYDDSKVYGFVASDSRQAALRKRLERSGTLPLAEDHGWALYDAEKLKPVAQRTHPSPDSHANALSLVETGKLELLNFDVLESRTSPGDSVTLRARYREILDSTQTRQWKKLTVRFLGPHEPVPEPLRGVSKVYRKLIQEKSLNSKARFTVSLVPNDGYPRFEAVWVEQTRVAVPGWLQAGNYRVSAKLENDVWRPVRSVADYLDDRSRWTGVAMDTLKIDPKGRTAR